MESIFAIENAVIIVVSIRNISDAVIIGINLRSTTAVIIVAEELLPPHAVNKDASKTVAKTRLVCLTMAAISLAS